MREIIITIMLVLLMGTATITLILQFINTRKLDKEMREFNKKYMEYLETQIKKLEETKENVQIDSDNEI